MRNWSYSLWMLVIYIGVFAVWRAFPSRACYLAVGGLAVAALIVGMLRAARSGYFLNRVDRSVHILVILDLILETVAFEAFRLVSPAAIAEQFHRNLNFFGCSLAFALIIGVHRWVCLYGPTLGRTTVPHRNLLADSYDS